MTTVFLLILLTASAALCGALACAACVARMDGHPDAQRLAWWSAACAMLCVWLLPRILEAGR